MADKKISQLDLAAQINNDAVIPMSQENGGEQTTYKALITAVAAKIGEGTTFSNLNTNAKNLVGAINEIEAGGGGGGSSNANLAPDYDATSTYAVGDWCIYNGTLYQCNTAIPTAEAFDPTHWTAKKVVDAFDDIEDELDDKVDTSDFLATQMPIESGSATNTKDYIDTGLNGKADTGDLALKQDKAILHIKKDFNNTYTIQTCIGALISEYGKNTMAFGFVLTGSGWYEGMMSFYDANQGGGYLIMNGGTPRLWAVSYQNGTVNVTEK